LLRDSRHVEEVKSSNAPRLHAFAFRSNRDRFLLHRGTIEPTSDIAEQVVALAMADSVPNGTPNAGEDVEMKEEAAAEVYHSIHAKS
jgi:hypothetical protein